MMKRRLLYVFLIVAPSCGTDQLNAQTDQQALPFTISDQFAPSGYMGDGEESSTAIVMKTMECKEPRPSGAVGDCYHVTYTPGGAGWAGVYWQYPENNWGDSPGKNVEAGATKVTFHAAGASGNELVQFVVGGVGDAKLKYQDSFKVSKMTALTTTLTSYQIDISGRDYKDGVLGAFAWVVEAPRGSRAPIQFYLDTIRWEK